MKTFTEKDWKTLSRLKPLALERLSRRILDESQRIIASAPAGESHSAYLKLYKHIYKQDKVMADCFDYWSRSNALTMLTLWRGHDLITDEEFAAFSPAAREATNLFLR